MTTNNRTIFAFSSYKCLFALVASLLLLVSSIRADSSSSAVSSSTPDDDRQQLSSPSSISSSCPNPFEAGRFYHRYHSPAICGNIAAKEFANSIQHSRHLGFQRLREEKKHHLVPDQETVICPAAVTTTAKTDGNDDDDDAAVVTGLMTVWMVENTASTSVVLSWVNPKTGKEFSALDGSISPPEADPTAILQPGQDTVVYGYEGHVFLAREISHDGVVGSVLLKHRLGLIPVGANFKNVKCKPNKGRKLLEEKKKILSNKKSKKPTKVAADDKSTTFWTMITGSSTTGGSLVPTRAKNLLTTFGFYATAVVGIPLKILGQYYFVTQDDDNNGGGIVSDPEPDEKTLESKYQRQVAEEQPLECNKVEVGFRNRSPCPLHASWVEMGNPVDDINKCSEHFRFHLGIQQHDVDNFMWDWTSTTKFESSFMGHQYVFRLAADPSQIVETVYLQPTKIVDCPNDKNKKKHVGGGEEVTTATAAIATDVGISTGEGSMHQTETDNNGDATMMLVENEITFANYSKEEIISDSSMMSGSPGGEGECKVSNSSSSSSSSQKVISEKAKETYSKATSVNKDTAATLPPPPATEEVNQEYKNFLKKLEGHPERMQEFLDYMRTHSNQYDKEV